MRMIYFKILLWLRNMLIINCKSNIKIIFYMFLVTTIPVNLYAMEQYTFAVVPQQSAQRLAQLWTPILDYVGKQSNVKLIFKTAPDIPEFEKRLAAGEYDVAYMNPYHYTVFSRKPGYRAFARRDKQPITGIFVVKKDSKIKSLKELHQANLAFPAPAAFAATILTQAELRAQNINFTPKYVSSHDSVYLNVAKSLTLAGGGVKRTFNNTNSETRNDLRILWESKGFTPHAFAAHPRLDDQQLAMVAQGFLSLNSSDEGINLLQSIKIKHGLIAAADSDWDDVRQLNIQLIK